MFHLMKKAMVLLSMVLGLLLMMGCPNPVNNDEVGNGGGDTQPGIIDIAAIPGVTAPAGGETPVTTIVETAQYTGTVSWSPDDNPFEYDTDYTATITLTAKSGYTLNGVAENFFTVAGADTVSNPVDSGVVTAVYQIHYTPEADFTWTESGGEVTITGYTGSASEVYIPDTFGGNPATVIGGNAFQWEASITTILMPDTIVTIENDAFANCTALEYLEIPEQVETIGFYAFMACQSLSNLSFPASLLSIEESAFSQCYALTAITVDPGNSAYADENGILYNKDITTLIHYPRAKPDATYTVPNTVTTIIDYAANEAKNIETLIIPGSVTTIGEYAFGLCEKITTLTLNEGITTIGSGAFYGSIALENAVVPASVSSLGTSAFGYCTSLTNIAVEAGNTVYKDTDGVLFTADDATLIQYPAGRSDTSYGIPAGTTTIIDDYAFQGSVSLANVTIPDSITTINVGTFNHCHALTEVDIPASVTTIGAMAFAQCDSLATVIVRAVTPPTLGNSAFMLNADVRKIYVPDANVDDYKAAEKWIDYADDIASIDSMP